MHSPTSHMMDRYTIGGVAPRLALAVAAFDDALPAENVAVSRGSDRAKSKLTA
jgi:hypothetical protein